MQVKLKENGYLVDGNMSVPIAPGNRHYREVQEWIAEGNTPEPADVHPEPDETEALISNEMRQLAIDSLIAKGKLTAEGKAVK